MKSLSTSPAAKLQMLLDMYEKGFLCKCPAVEKYIPPDTEPEWIICNHEEDCIGKAKIIELLNLE